MTTKLRIVIRKNGVKELQYLVRTESKEVAPFSGGGGGCTGRVIIREKWLPIPEIMEEDDE